MPHNQHLLWSLRLFSLLLHLCLPKHFKVLLFDFSQFRTGILTCFWSSYKEGRLLWVLGWDDCFGSPTPPVFAPVTLFFWNEFLLVWAPPHQLGHRNPFICYFLRFKKCFIFCIWIFLKTWKLSGMHFITWDKSFWVIFHSARSLVRVTIHPTASPVEFIPSSGLSCSKALCKWSSLWYQWTPEPR